MAIQYSLCGEGLCIGYDGGDAVSRLYTPRSSSPAARISQVEFNVSGEEDYAHAETRLAALHARD